MLEPDTLKAMKRWCWLLVWGAAAGSHAVVVGQKDDFQTGTLLGWGGGNNPTLTANGVGGAADFFMRLTTTNEGGPGSNLATFNMTQWTGDFTSAKVKTIEADMRNAGLYDVHMRVIFWDAVSNKWGSKEPLILWGGSNTWTHHVFHIDQPNMVSFNGAGTYADVMGQVTRMMFRHNETVQLGGEPVFTTFDIDNVVAGAGRMVSGKVNLEEVQSVGYPVKAVAEFRTPGTTTVVVRRPLDIEQGGVFTIDAPPVPGSYDLAVKVTHWLRQVVRVNTTVADATNVLLSLPNGDIDQDNAVTVFDYSVLSDYFDKTAEGGDWSDVGANGFAPYEADLDQDGSVTVFDYSILSSNFDLAGAD